MHLFYPRCLKTRLVPILQSDALTECVLILLQARLGDHEVVHRNNRDAPNQEKASSKGAGRDDVFEPMEERALVGVYPSFQCFVPQRTGCQNRFLPKECPYGFSKNRSGKAIPLDVPGKAHLLWNGFLSTCLHCACMSIPLCIPLSPYERLYLYLAIVLRYFDCLFSHMPSMSTKYRGERRTFNMQYQNIESPFVTIAFTQTIPSITKPAAPLTITRMIPATGWCHLPPPSPLGLQFPHSATIHSRPLVEDLT